MSLLDDVSIVVTPNGYKAGELYAVIPVPSEGVEEGTNMDFSSGTSPWALNSNWSLGGVGVIADGTSDSTIWQSGVVEDNKQYIVTYTLTDFLQGSINVDLSGGNGITRTVAGTYTEVITSGTIPTTRLSLEGNGNFKVTLSNVIVKEYTSADMDVTRSTAATRVDKNGLVNYAEVLGGEEIIDGDFALPNVNWSLGGGTEVTVDGLRINNTVITGNAYAIQTLSVSTSSKQFVLTYDVITTNGEDLFLEQASGLVLNTSTTGVNRKLYFTWDKVDSRVTIKRINAGTDVTIDNVSIKEVTRDNVPRIDYTGGEDILGGEEIIDGDFPTPNVNWTIQGGASTTWVINNNTATRTGSANWGLYQNITRTVGSLYKITFNVLTNTSGTLAIVLGGGAANVVSGTGSKTLYLIWDGSTDKFSLQNNFIGSIENISVKEVTGNTGVASCPHILAEPQRTNVFIQNDISTWNGFSSYADETTAPDGTTIDFVNMEDRRIFPTTTISNSTEYTSSIYLKGNKTANVKLRNTAANDTVITLSAEWQRFELTATSSSTLTNALLIDARYGQGMGAAGLEIAIYGGQVEEGSYATSYIPTSGSTVTRNQDIFTRDGIGSLINSTEGVLFVEMARQEGDASAGIITLNNGTATQAVALYYFSTGTIYFDIISSSSTVSGGVGGFNTYNFNKIALKYKSGDIALWVNGVEVLTRTNTISLTGLNKLSFDYGGGALPFYGKVKQLQVYKTALTDVQLAALTS